MTIFFPDIAGYQAGIDLAGALAVTIKVTEGTGYTSGQYTVQAAEAAGHGAFQSAYHFLHAGNGAGQADYCHAHAGKTPLMVDVEPTTYGAAAGPDRAGKLNRRSALSSGYRHASLSATSAPTVADAAAFTDRYRADGGTLWWCYFPKWYWEQLGRPSLTPLINRGLLLWSSVYVPYTDDGAGAGWAAYGAWEPLAWQYTSTMAFGGVREVDFDAFRGHYAGKQDPASVAACLAEFKSLTLTGKWPVSPPTEETVQIPNVHGTWKGEPDVRITPDKKIVVTGYGLDDHVWSAVTDLVTGAQHTPVKIA